MTYFQRLQLFFQLFTLLLIQLYHLLLRCPD
jgi:hypothetical protein